MSTVPTSPWAYVVCAAAQRTARSADVWQRGDTKRPRLREKDLPAQRLGCGLSGAVAPCTFRARRTGLFRKNARGFVHSLGTTHSYLS